MSLSDKLNEKGFRFGTSREGDYFYASQIGAEQDPESDINKSLIIRGELGIDSNTVIVPINFHDSTTEVSAVVILENVCFLKSK